MDLESIPGAKVVEHYIEEVVDILTYGGNETDIQINYGMLLLSICCWCLTVLRLFFNLKDFLAFLISCLYILFMVQILSCLLLHCTGISGVWCAMVGFSYRTWLRIPSDRSLINRLIILGTFASYLWANIYYFQQGTESYFTTFCHLAATWLGYEANYFWYRSQEERTKLYEGRQKKSK